MTEKNERRPILLGIRILPAILLSVLLLTNCSFRRIESFSAGREITPEDLERMIAEAGTDGRSDAAGSSSGQTDETETVGGTESENLPTDSDVVYWVAGGEVWHLRRDCSSIAGAASVQEGSEADARAAGKDRVCKRCGG